MRLAFRSVASVLAVVALAGCSSQQTGTAIPNRSTSTVSSSAAPAAKPQQLLAPPVSKPLNAANYLKPDSVCKILDNKQLAMLGISGSLRTQVSNERGLAIGCDYGINDFGVNISFMTGNKGGLSDIYRQRVNDKYWDPSSIQGYPAVAAAGSDARAQGTCVVNVGVNDDLAFFAQYIATSTKAKPQPCEKAKAAADQVVTSLIKYPNP